MHPLENGIGVPAFLAKLWRLVEDSETNNLISWSSVNIFDLNSNFEFKHGSRMNKETGLTGCNRAIVRNMRKSCRAVFNHKPQATNVVNMLIRNISFIP